MVSGSTLTWCSLASADGRLGGQHKHVRWAGLLLHQAAPLPSPHPPVPQPLLLLTHSPILPAPHRRHPRLLCGGCTAGPWLAASAGRHLTAVRRHGRGSGRGETCEGERAHHCAESSSLFMRTRAWTPPCQPALVFTALHTRICTSLPVRMGNHGCWAC